QILRGRGAENYGRVLSCDRVEKGSVLDRGVQSLQEGDVSGPDRDATALDVGYLVRAEDVSIWHRAGCGDGQHRTDPPDHSGGSLRQVGLGAAQGLAGWNGQQIRAQRIELGQQPGLTRG